MKKHIDLLIDNLKATFAERLLSVILYGTSATIDDIESSIHPVPFPKNLFIKPEHSADLIVILDKLDASDLKKAHASITEWKKTGHPLPVFMDEDEWFSSTDIYPMEYFDIKKRHKILYGEDYIAPLNISKANLRLQCEYELKNLLIKLRENYLGNAENTRFLTKVVIKSSEKLIALFRSILELSEEAPPVLAIDVINKLDEKITIDTELFKTILLSKSEKAIIYAKEIDDIISRLIDSLNTLLKYVDNLEVS